MTIKKTLIYCKYPGHNCGRPFPQHPAQSLEMYILFLNLAWKSQQLQSKALLPSASHSATFVTFQKSGSDYSSTSMPVVSELVISDQFLKKIRLVKGFLPVTLNLFKYPSLDVFTFLTPCIGSVHF